MEAVDAQSGTISSATLRPFRYVKKGYTYFEENDVIFAKITPCMQNGKQAVCRGLHGGFGFGSTEFHVLRPGPELRSEWLHYFLRQPELLDDAQRYLTGTVGQQRLPDISIQRRIVTQLSEKLAASERLNARLREEFAAIESLPAVVLRRAFNNHP
jgi:type I restriction enzyme S subunit